MQLQILISHTSLYTVSLVPRLPVGGASLPHVPHHVVSMLPMTGEFLLKSYIWVSAGQKLLYYSCQAQLGSLDRLMVLAFVNSLQDVSMGHKAGERERERERLIKHTHMILVATNKHFLH